MQPDRANGLEEKIIVLKHKCLHLSPLLKLSKQQSALFVLNAARDTRDEKPSNVHYNQGLAHIHHWLNLSFLSYSLMPKCEKVSMPELNF